MLAAGLTNVLWMAQGKAIVQLTPYGWCALTDHALGARGSLSTWHAEQPCWRSVLLPQAAICFTVWLLSCCCCCRDLGDGRYQAVEIIQQMVLNMNCSHHLWVNKRAEHSYFVEHDFEVPPACLILSQLCSLLGAES